MDQVTISRELLRQAAELLGGAITYDWHGNPSEEFDRECNAAATALRAALEQPAVEPVYWGQPDACGNIVDGITTEDKELGHKGWVDEYKVPLYTAPQAQQPAPVQEPVTDEENERFSQDVSNFSGADPEATKYALKAFLRRRAPAPQAQPLGAQQPAPVQEPELAGYVNPTSLSVMRIGEFDWIKLYSDNAGGHIPLYTSHHPDKAAQLEAANTNLFEQGQKMHKRIQELERDCKIGVSAMLEYCEEIDRLKAQQPRKAVKLSDDEIEKLQYEHVGVTKWFPNLARAIEAAVLKKNGVTE